MSPWRRGPESHSPLHRQTRCQSSCSELKTMQSNNMSIWIKVSTWQVNHLNEALRNLRNSKSRGWRKAWRISTRSTCWTVVKCFCFSAARYVQPRTNLQTALVGRDCLAEANLQEGVAKKQFAPSVWVWDGINLEWSGKDAHSDTAAVANLWVAWLCLCEKQWVVCLNNPFRKRINALTNIML